MSGAYSRVEYLKGTSVVSAPAISPNIRLGRKSLPGTKTLAYYKKIVNYGQKMLMTLAPGPNIKKKFYSRKLYMFIIC